MRNKDVVDVLQVLHAAAAAALVGRERGAQRRDERVGACADRVKQHRGEAACGARRGEAAQHGCEPRRLTGNVVGVLAAAKLLCDEESPHRLAVHALVAPRVRRERKRARAARRRDDAREVGAE